MLIALFAGVGCGSPDAGSPASGGVGPAGGGTIELTQAGGCSDVFMWAATADGDVAVTFLWNRPAQLQGSPIDMDFVLPDDAMTVNVERGHGLHRNMCTDMIDVGAEPSSVDAVTGGSGHLTVSVANLPDGRSTGVLRLDDLEGPDGLRFAPIEVTTGCIGCADG